MKRHDEEIDKEMDEILEETHTPVSETEEVKTEEDYLKEVVEEDDLEEKKTPLSHTLMMFASAILLLSTAGVIAWGYTDVQKERENAMNELRLPEGKPVSIQEEEQPKEKVEKTAGLSYEEASVKLEDPMNRYAEHATRTDEMSMKFMEDPNVAYTTEWKMDYQSEMKQLREANAEIQGIIQQTESNVLNETGAMFNDGIEIAQVRYEAIVEKDKEKLAHSFMLMKELNDKMPEYISWFE